MREIKFRAWDGSIMLNRTLFDRNWYVGNKCAKGAMPDDLFNLKVMQYTGYKCKGSSEIYEDDLVLLTNFNYLNYDNEAVSVSGVGRIQFDMAGWRVVFNDELEIDSIDLYEVYHECKVIGNFHQNPELIEV